MPAINLRGSRLTAVLAVIGAMCFALQGYDQNVLNGLLTLQTWVDLFPQINTNVAGPDLAHKKLIQGTVVALYEAGCAIGALQCAFTGDILGRKRTVFISGIVALIGIIIEASPFSLAQLIVGRVIAGIAVGSFTATVPMWISECTRAARRGRMVLLEGWFAIGGIALCAWIEFGFYYVTNNSVNWRFPIALQALFALVVISAVLFMPESPRWLVKQDRMTDAAKSLSLLDDLPVDSPILETDLANIRHGLFAEHVGTSGNPFALTENRHLHRTVLAIVVNILAQMSGINIITFYSTTIFQQELGYSGTISRVISGCLQIWQTIAAGLAVFLVDRIGRRKLLISGAIGMTIATTALAGLESDLSNKSAAGASIFFYFVALFCFPIGLFLVPFMYAAEIVPLRIRAKVTAMSASSNWLFNFLIAEVTPIGFQNISWRYYIIYASINLSAIIIYYLFYPETKGRSLEEIDDIFIQSKGVFDPVRLARELPIQQDELTAGDGMKKDDMAEVEKVT